MKNLQHFNNFSFIGNDKVQVNVTPISVKFNCKSCNKTNKTVIGHIVAMDDADFDIANSSNRIDAVWHLNCNFCNTRNEIYFIIKHYEEEK